MSLIAEQLKNWRDEGFLILPDFFSKEEVDSLNILTDYIWTNRKYIGIPLIIDNGISNLFSEIELRERDKEYKIRDLYLNYQEVRQIVLNKRLCIILESLLNGKPLVFNTASFEMSSDLLNYCDTFYNQPAVKDKMLSTWICLSDADELKPLLRYYPGSHKIPAYIFSHGRLQVVSEEINKFNEYMDNELTSREIKVKYFTPSIGDVFIQHCQLLHGEEKSECIGIKSQYYRYCDMQHVPRADFGDGRYFMLKSHLEQTGV